MTNIDKFYHQLEHPTGTIDFLDIQHTDELGNVNSSTEEITTFNNISSPSDFEKHLVELYGLMCNEVNEKLKESSDAKFTKLLYLETFQEKNKNLLKIIIAEQYESGVEAYHHKNLEVKNISDRYEDQHQSNFHSSFKDYLLICTDFINKFQEYISKRVEYVIRLEEKDFLSQSNTSVKKLKTNLTVSEIGCLFRILKEEKLIEADTQTEIFNFISNSFESKKVKQLSVKSVKNDYDSPESKPLEFWDTTFTRFKQIIQRLQK